jgi:SNF2 family DNA or RNA helicase
MHTLDVTEDGQFALSCSPRYRDLAAQVPGLRFHKPSETWRGPARLSVAHALRGIFGDQLTPTPAALAAVEAEAQEHARVQAIKDGSDPTPNDIVHDLALNGLRTAQQAASRLSALRGGFLIGDEKGYGKSVEAAGALNLVHGVSSPYPALIVCTNSMKYTWEEEIEKWCGVPVAVMGRTATQRKAAIEEVSSGAASVLVCSWSQVRLHSRLAPYGSFARTEEEKQDKELNAIPFKTVICDEAHALKNPKAKQTLAVKAVSGAEACVNRWALTATPVTGHTADLWSVLNFCRPEDFPSRSKFIDRYVLIHENFHGGKEDLGLNPATEAEFRRIFDPCYIRRPLDLEVKALPPQYRFVEMGGKQRSVYKQIEKDSIANVDGRFLVSVGPLVLNTRLQQLAQATPVLDDDGNVTEFTLPSCKYDAPCDVLDEMGGEPLVVFSESRKLIELCQRELTGGRTPRFRTEQVGMITGAISPEERHRWITEFQAGILPVILCTLGAGSEGVTLTRANTMLFLNRSYKYVANQQAEGRILRHGQTRDCQVIDVLALDTEELRVHDSSAGKEAIFQQIVQDPDHQPREVPRESTAPRNQ